MGEDNDIVMVEYELAQLLYELCGPVVFTHIICQMIVVAPCYECSSLIAWGSSMKC